MVHLKIRVGPKGQVVLPKPIRDELEIRPGDELTADVVNGKVEIAPYDKHAVLDDFLETAGEFDVPENLDADALYDEMMSERMRRKGVL